MLPLNSDSSVLSLLNTQYDSSVRFKQRKSNNREVLLESDRIQCHTIRGLRRLNRSANAVIFPSPSLCVHNNRGSEAHVILDLAGIYSSEIPIYAASILCGPPCCSSQIDIMSGPYHSPFVHNGQSYGIFCGIFSLLQPPNASANGLESFPMAYMVRRSYQP